MDVIGLNSYRRSLTTCIDSWNVLGIVWLIRLTPSTNGRSFSSVPWRNGLSIALNEPQKPYQGLSR